MANPKFFRFPFGATGDKTTLPDDVQQSGNVSYAEGWGYDYERNPVTDAAAKRIERDKMNQLHHDITSNIQQYQLYGFPWFYDASTNGGTPIAYQKQAVVRYSNNGVENLYISKIDNNLKTPSDSQAWQLFNTQDQVPLSKLTRTPFVPVISMDTVSPPSNPSIGDCYIIGKTLLGGWPDKNNQLAEWDGEKWNFTVTPNGHGVATPNGDLYQKINGQYQLKIAQDVQSNKWQYAEAGGTNNALIITLNPKPIYLTTGMTIRLKIKQANTGPVTLSVNGLEANTIIYHETAENLIGGDFNAGDIVELTFDGTSWRLAPTLNYMDNRYSRLTLPPSDTFYVVGPTGNDNNSGLAATPSQGFATIQGAIKFISKRYITTGTVTIYVSPGTYVGFDFNPSMVQNWQIIGNPANPSSVVIDARNVAAKNVRGCVCYAGTATIKGFLFRSYYENVAASGGTLSIYDCIFEQTTTTTTFGAYGSTIYLHNKITISKNGYSIFSASQGGSIQFGYSDEIVSNPVNVIFNGISVTQIFSVDSAGTIIIRPTACSFSGAVNGSKYSISTNGVILTYGGGVNFLPGSSQGYISTGGQIA